MNAQPFTAWRCYAKPAELNGKTCGHMNDAQQSTVFHGQRLVYCAGCGRTKHASDLRQQRAQRKETSK